MEPPINEEILEADEADLIDQREPVEPAPDGEFTDPDEDYPHAAHSGLEPDDPLLDVIVRVYADFADHTSLADTIELVVSCRDQLDIIANPAALPELVERLARQRLTDTHPDGTDPPTTDPDSPARERVPQS